ncbi:hypothetical protein K458DRAFT_348372 [Lentithecium fluviatile CBS 122367]|uniref:DUF6536 domain-containing protein n=1 Tax=Lentithecium fluviatile CBS 122367 TaxID=1168545 RepID=A0A6G1IKD3_9PLEO|nr:hypothetical protein K458DRAFT_348372 [Lentithecium fluviatile CBS 122367]
MSSGGDSSKRVTRPPPRPPTPGPVFNNAGELLDRNLIRDSEIYITRPISIDLAASPKASSVWIEMDPSPAIQNEYEDTFRLLGRGRSSSVTSTSSDVVQGRTQQYLNSLSNVFASVAGLHGVRKLSRAFERWDSKIAALRSRSRFHGWKMGVLIGCYMSASILLFNIAVVIIVAIKAGFHGDTAILPFTFDSDSMSRLSSGIHILINAFSTILLCASNYTMQVLSSPTRKDLDKAHSMGQWFDIGVLSSRNLKRIPRKQLAFCLVMGLTSIPLHLFYNSAAVYISSTNDYECSLLNHTSSEWQTISNDPSYVSLSGRQWQSAYKSVQIDYGDLYLAFNDSASEVARNATGYPKVKADVPSNLNMSDFVGRPGSLTLMRDLTFNITSFDWITPRDNIYLHIVGARARSVTSRSRIQLSLRFMIIVIVCNALKLAMMLWVLFLERSDFIVTLGDGAATYLEDPDPHTEGFSVFNREAIITNCGAGRVNVGNTDRLGNLVQNAHGIWRKQYHNYSSSLDRDREIGSYFIFIVLGTTLLLCIALAVTGTIQRNWGSASNRIIGSSSNGPQNTLLLAWLANAPQLALSFCYLAINSECTSMAGAREWNQFGTFRKGLRVTKPTHEQRSTYFLQLPYKYSLPLTVVSGALHWLLSQSVYLVRVDFVERDGSLNPSQSKTGIGISGLSFLTLCSTFWGLVVAVGLVGRRRLRVRIPFAAGCSLVVSAACHAPEDNGDAHLRPVQWGVVEEKMFDGELHCSLSSQKVSMPKEGIRYR